MFALAVLLPAAAIAAFEPIELDYAVKPIAGAYNTRVTFSVRAVEGQEAALETVARWQLQLAGFEGTKLDYRQGQGTPPATLDWTAVRPDGTLLPDGFYKARFVWADARGANHGTPAVEVSVLAPPGLREVLSDRVRLAVEGDDAVLRVAEDLPFRPGDAAIKPAAFPSLLKIARFLQLYPDQRVVIQGHADARGGAAANLEVSRRRALALYRFFADQGVDATRMRYEGLGAEHPIASNDTEAGRARNRRVDIVLRDVSL